MMICVLSACDRPTRKSEVVLSTTTTEPSTSQQPTTATTTVLQDSDSTEAEILDKSEIEKQIILNDENTIIKGTGVSFEENKLTITQSGIYSLTGTLTNGQIYINCSDEDKKVKLYFDGVTVSCADDAPIFVENSPKETVIILAGGTVNTLTDSAGRVVPADGSDYATATVYSKDDLQIEGSGTLNIYANFNKGIFSKNDIDIRGGKINITSADDGIRGKDSVEISDGDINITSSGDGIRTSEEQYEDKGDITVSGGNINITSTLDGIQATGSLKIEGGTLNIKSGSGAAQFAETENMPQSPGDMMNNRGPGGKGGFFRNPPPDSSSYEQTTEDTPSEKSLKAARDITLSECSLTIDSSDDAIHANNVLIQSGLYLLKSSDDAIHADSGLTVCGGKINIPMSYEGIEAQTISISDGKISLTSSDDGLNAVSPDSDSSSMHNPFAADSNCYINISGGDIFVDAQGDGIDSNGDVSMSDGTLIVFGPENGANGSLDYAGRFNISGGTLLAVGSAGMAQTVTGEDDVRVFACNYSQQAQTLSAVVDDDGELVIGFKSTKPFQTMILASEEFDEDDVYTLYQGGSISGTENNGVYFQGIYSGGTQVGVLS